MLPVHVRVVDAATRQPLAVRLRVTDHAGRSCVPLGRPAVFRTGPGEDVGGQVRLDGEDWYYVDGGAEMFIPPGSVRLDAWHGFEYRPLVHEAVVKAGQLALRVELERWTDERARGWYSGDIAAFEMTPHAALLEGAAEDLAVVNLLASEEDAGPAVRLPNLTAFSGPAPALERSGHLLAVGTLNRHPEAMMALLGCHRPVYPLQAGPDWSPGDWCDQAHRKRDGLVVWLRPGVPPAGLAGKLDAFAVRGPALEGLEGWAALLGSGVRLPLVAASGKADNRTLLGWPRTYAGLDPGQAFSYPAWLEAVRRGRTFVTTGPLLDLGAAAARARSAVPYDRLEVVADGRVVATAEPAGPSHEAAAPAAVAADWVAARCVANGAVVAHTSARAGG